MRKFNNFFLDFLYLVYRWVTPIFIFRPQNFLKYFTFYFPDLFMYKIKSRKEKIRLIDTFPIVNEKTTTTPFDAHYFYQSAWAARRIKKANPAKHVDVGSQINFIGDISAFIPTTFIDLRPLKGKLQNLENKKGSILDLPYKNNSVESISCLHVAEHIGLGRYGDKIDPNGTKKAAAELSRVLAINGNLYFSLPIGKPRLCFNAHRIHAPETIIQYFKELKIKEISGVDDKGNFIENVSVNEMKKWDYGCGLFHFTKSQK